MPTSEPSLPFQNPSAPRHYLAAIQDLLENMYYRQSMIADYKTCPQMMLYKWILQHEEDDIWLAAILGTAGHSVIEEMHRSRRFDIPYVELVSLFENAVAAAISHSKAPPRISKQFDSLKAQCDSVTPEYVTMLQRYMMDETNQTFHATMLEQRFILPLTDEHGREFLFTGMIDQAGFYPNGQFALRDIKFRQNAFKPGRVALRLNMQLSMYALGLKYGLPACDNCTPQYSMEGELLYTGPCSECRSLYEPELTPKWPRLAPEKVELIWMRDYEPRGKDEYAKFLTSDTEKEKNPKTGRMVKKKILNPKWIDGYKKGDQTGPAILGTVRSMAFLEVHKRDLLVLAGMIRDGRFYRKEGADCNFWCKFSKPCMEALENEIDDIDIGEINEHMCTLDPFEKD